MDRVAKPPSAGLIPPDKLSDKIYNLFRALCLKLAYSVLRHRKGEPGNGRKAFGILRQLATLQADAMRAGAVLGALSPWLRRVNPVPKGSTLPDVQLSEPAAPPTWLVNIVGRVKAAFSQGVISAADAKQMITRYYRNAGFDVPTSIDLPKPVIAFETPPSEIPMLIGSSEVIATGEQGVKDVYLTLDEGAKWLEEKGLVDMDHFRRLAQTTAVDQAINTDNLMTNLFSELKESIAAGETPEQFAKRIEDLAAPPDHSVYTLLRTSTKRSYVAGHKAVMEDEGVRSLLPYYLYMATDDDRVREEHWALDGVVVSVDDDESVAYEDDLLNDYNCRCTRVSITEAEARERGLSGIIGGEVYALEFPNEDED
jgi:SPP1 gp7 family putative phage head morphogenesis protein